MYVSAIKRNSVVRNAFMFEKQGYSSREITIVLVSSVSMVSVLIDRVIREIDN